MKRFVLFGLLLFISSVLFAQSNLVIPDWFATSFKRQKLNEIYRINNNLTPVYLQADFNGDGLTDIVVPVVEKRTTKKGIMLMHSGTNKYFVFGAGIRFGNGSDDFTWAKGWKLYNKRVANTTVFNSDGDITGSKTVKLKRPGIAIWDLTDGQPNSGAIIYWNGLKYLWIHQGE